MILEPDIRFAEYLASTRAVRFGDFRLKSGRASKVFFDFGEVSHGEQLVGLGGFYADFIVANGFETADVLFGPAYKGISIAIATSIAMRDNHGIDMPFAYNRKVEKDHAEGGAFVGQDLSCVTRALVVDDVITDGATKYEAIAMLSQFPNLIIEAFIVGVDRQEVDAEGVPCVRRFAETTGLRVCALTTMEKVLRFKR